MKPVYEVASGSILLSKREDFFRLHRDWLLPMMHKIGIRPVLLLMTEIGSYGKFLDITATTVSRSMRNSPTGS
jgi:hypothetical protein